ncbi:NB-ARC domains-containing protein, partial [Tanacetum coccineum]
NEAEAVSEILRNIQQALNSTLPMAVTDGLVGIESRVDEVKRILIMESSDVRFIGICWMSGVGKTTLAEAVYGAIKKDFQGSSFIENIKDVSKQSDCSSLCKQ